MPVGHEELGDALAVRGLAHSSAGNAQNDYYTYMLLKEKLQQQRVPDEVQKRVLGARSEKEALELHILTVIQGEEYGESSANFSQLVDLTGTRNKIEQSKFLAEKVYEREATKMILNRFAPPPSGATNNDPVTGGALLGFQALINRPRQNESFGSGSLWAQAMARVAGGAA